MLSGPDVLDGTNISSTMKSPLLRAAAGFDLDEFNTVRCVCFDDRAEADEWILRRHTGDMEGEGRINWGRTEIQRFTGDRSVLDVIDFVGRNADYTDEEWESTKSTIESKKSSNIGRLLDSAAGRNHLGISIAKESEGKTPLLSRDPEWAVLVLKKIIEDVRDGVVDSRSHNTASEIEQYFRSLPKNLQPKGKKLIPKAFKEINLKVSTSSITPKKVNQSRTRGVPKLRRTLAPKRNSFNPPPSEKGKRLLHEAATIDAGKLTISSAFVLRAFIELSLNDYMSAHNIPSNKKKKDGKIFELTLSQRADAVMKKIIDEGIASRKDMHGFYTNVVSNSASSSIQSLNGFVHNQVQIPTPEALRAGWDCCVPVFEAAYGKI